MAKINQYPAKTVPSNNDEFVLHDTGSGSTKKMTRGDLIGGAPLPANSVNEQAIADGSVTATKTSFGGDYSTSEVNTGFKWIDGKDIYKKTVNLGGLPNATTKTVSHGIVGYTNFISISGWASNGSVWTPLPYVGNINPLGGSQPNNNVLLAVSGGNITIDSSSNRSAYTTAFATLEYTKS